MGNSFGEPRLTPVQRQVFVRDGFLVMRQLAPAERLQNMRRVALEHLQDSIAPIEYEADVAYPGAPASRAAAGGDTARRLLQAYDRHQVFAEWARNPRVTAIVAQLLETADLRLTRAHHNCIMIKQPAFSSATGWHQDLRYWAFSSPQLINAWLALGDETPANGCMRLIPGSHEFTVDPARLDAAKFLDEAQAANRAWVASAETAALAPGDVLFFHAGVFHAAGRNKTDERKLSVVFTYHRADNAPLAGTRSAHLPPAAITAGGG